MENTVATPKEKLRAELKDLALSRGWPEIRPAHFGLSIFGGVVLGFIIGNVVLLFLTGGSFEGYFRLVHGEGGPFGVITIPATTIIGAVVGLMMAFRTTSGEQEWTEWLSQRDLSNDVLSRVKILLERKPKV